MAEFTLDTTGTVEAHMWRPLTGRRQYIRWSDLTPFQQGYVEAALFDWSEHEAPAWGNLRRERWGFSDLAPETLAAMLKDCAKYQSFNQEVWNSAHGRELWERRQRSYWPTILPPLTLYLGDDGKVHQRTA